jgi:hypothetical protein
MPNGKLKYGSMPIVVSKDSLCVQTIFVFIENLLRRLRCINIVRIIACDLEKLARVKTVWFQEVLGV